ncbi:hypothetical protein C173_12100 [Paenibacillus sp. FSL R7-277]|uniref:DUF7002 family protein n=1 Tax=Paenibacillus sp. FSL R7-277 TaxID=1227352 RepID=UPI0003E25CF9|nr:hypothetical protein [Paenibacillus sp. FSL R7-277]ETT73318.1 hypothetical protein C173_12100 [Paenibacillus sp. FSL R7-277]
MNPSLIDAITKSPLRTSFYHFTRAVNLPAMAAFDTIYSSAVLSPAHAAGERRAVAHRVSYAGQAAILNAHLRITPEAMDPGTTAEEFRRCLDRHVFLWPTWRDCLAMAAMYSRREPGEVFAVLKLDARRVLADHYTRIRLSKYDSGSSPRFPHRMAYRKSCRMLLPLAEFMSASGRDIPVKPSEIKEVLAQDKLAPLSQYLQTVYCSQPQLVPELWQPLCRPLLLSPM